MHLLWFSFLRGLSEFTAGVPVVTARGNTVVRVSQRYSGDLKLGAVLGPPGVLVVKGVHFNTEQIWLCTNSFVAKLTLRILLCRILVVSFQQAADLGLGNKGVYFFRQPRT